MSELLHQVLVDKTKRNQIATKKIAQKAPAGEAWGGEV